MKYLNYFATPFRTLVNKIQAFFLRMFFKTILSTFCNCVCFKYFGTVFHFWLFFRCVLPCCCNVLYVLCALYVLYVLRVPYVLCVPCTVVMCAVRCVQHGSTVFCCILVCFAVVIIICPVLLLCFVFHLRDTSRFSHKLETLWKTQRTPKNAITNGSFSSPLFLNHHPKQVHFITPAPSVLPTNPQSPTQH